MRNLIGRNDILSAMKKLFHVVRFARRDHRYGRETQRCPESMAISIIQFSLSGKSAMNRGSSKPVTAKPEPTNMAAQAPAVVARFQYRPPMITAPEPPM